MAWLGIFGAAALMRVFLGCAGTSFDEFVYAHLASDVARGQFDPNFITATEDYGFRWTVFMPVSLLYRWLGLRDWTTALYPLLCSLGNVALACAWGRSLYGRREGWIAGGLLAFFPLHVLYGPRLVPDEILLFFLNLALYMQWRASTGNSPAFRATAALSCAAGAALGAAYFARPTALAAVPLLAALSWRGNAGRRASFFWILGLGLVLAGESLAYWRVTGDPLFHWRHAPGYVASQSSWVPLELGMYPQGMFGGNLFALAHLGFFYPAFLASVAWLAWKRELRSAAFPLIWAFFLFAYLEFGVVSLRPLVPVFKRYHYLAVLSVPVVLVLTRAWSLLPSSVWKRAAPLAFLGITSLAGATLRHHRCQADRDVHGAVARSLRRLGAERIFVDHRGGLVAMNYFFRDPFDVPFYAGPEVGRRRRVRWLKTVEDPAELAGAHVVLYHETAADRARLTPDIRRLLEREAAAPDATTPDAVIFRIQKPS